MNIQRPILLTGFEPFAGQSRNPSGEVVAMVAKSWPASELVAEILPVAYTAAGRRIAQLFAEHKPRCWIGLGLNQRATAITLEQVAVNLDDAALADNSGETRRNLPINPNDLPFYRSTLPAEQFARVLRANNIPVVYSENAGRFVCNHLFYLAGKLISDPAWGASGGFIHVPWPSDWSDQSVVDHDISLSTIYRATNLCLQAISSQ